VARNYHVTRKPEGDWQARAEGAGRASSLHNTQAAAEAAAKGYAANAGGGQVYTHGRNGRIRSADTIGLPDPFPPRDREH
jgi:Uncharacterized protein conserved in bacteria (DUF2188)